MPRIPTHRTPTTPGEMLRLLYIEPMGLTQTEVARATGISFQRLNDVIHGRRAVTPSTALRLARYFGTTPGMWLNAQQAVDLYNAEREEAQALERIIPVVEAA